MPDFIIKCKNCGSDFYFTEGEQFFYKQKGLNIPKYCKQCRTKKDSSRDQSPMKKRYIFDFDGVAINMYDLDYVTKIKYGGYPAIEFTFFDKTKKISYYASYWQRDLDYDKAIEILNSLK